MGGCRGIFLTLSGAPEGPGFFALGMWFVLFLGRWRGKEESTGTTAGCDDGEGVHSKDFTLPTTDAVRSEELPSLKGVTSLANRVLRALGEAKKEEAMNIPRWRIVQRRG